MGEVFVKRMGGFPQSAERISAIQSYLSTFPPAPATPIADQDAVSRGEKVFNDDSVGCTTCHNGKKLTDNKNANVGTGGSFQVPSLHGVGARAPYMHTGCAATLTDRFTDTKCGGGESHGRTAQLSADQISDLVAYLQAL